MPENCPNCGVVSEQEFERRINFTCGTSVYGGFLYEDVDTGYPPTMEQSDLCRANAAEGKLAEQQVTINEYAERFTDAEDEITRLQELRGELSTMRAAFRELLEVAYDLRCYTQDWDWKYGEGWDAELEKAAKAGGDDAET